MRTRAPVPDHQTQLIADRARSNRHAPTAPEAKLWSELSARKLGVTFRRQVPIAHRFIADFYAPACKLIVEVDGPHHARQRRADARRDAKMRRLGYRVFRLSAELVMTDLPAAVALVSAAIAQPP
jgi:very-short-patch-repair endonuclease